MPGMLEERIVVVPMLLGAWSLYETFRNQTTSRVECIDHIFFFETVLLFFCLNLISSSSCPTYHFSLFLPYQAPSIMNDCPSVSSKKSQTSYSSNPFRDDSTSRGDFPERETYQPPEVAKQEEANILKAKILVALIIVLAVSGVGSATYLLVKDQEKTNFENQFAGYSSEIITVSRQKADQLFSALDAFSASIASQADAENALRNTTWPYYVIPDWSIKAQRLTKLIGVSNPEVTLVSIVQPNERGKFTEFAKRAVPMWYQESVENEKTEMTAIEFWQRTVPFIHFYDNLQATPATGTNESQVLFQIYPLKVIRDVPLTPVMYDSANSGGANALADIAKVIRKPTIGFTVLYEEDNVGYPGSAI
eukprot:scaffold14714_cov108-Cylindrotheca_fusiformis.AAC.3